MPKLTDYVDIREVDDDYQHYVCPECGVERWFSYIEYDYEPDNWRCETCSARLVQDLEYPCVDCDVRMINEDVGFVCKNQDCDNRGVEINHETLIDRLSDDAYIVKGMNSKFLECPMCGEESILSKPDGELVCDKCGDFYAGQYQDSWYCYAIWMQEPDKIRVRNNG